MYDTDIDMIQDLPETRSERSRSIGLKAPIKYLSASCRSYG